MLRIDNPAPIVAAAAIVLFGAALAYRLLSLPESAQLMPPSFRGEPVKMLSASVPDIGDFDSEFHVNVENPFVPYADRKIESDSIT